MVPGVESTEEGVPLPLRRLPGQTPERRKAGAGGADRGEVGALSLALWHFPLPGNDPSITAKIFSLRGCCCNIGSGYIYGAYTSFKKKGCNQIYNKRLVDMTRSGLELFISI